MFKLLAMIITFLLVALSLLAIRQHRLELTAQSAKIYDQIRERNQTLLDQQVQIAKITNPWAVASALEKSGVNVGDALKPKITNLNKTTPTPAIETDLTAP